MSLIVFAVNTYNRTFFNVDNSTQSHTTLPQLLRWSVDASRVTSRICPIGIYGSSTRRAPIHVNRNTPAPVLENLWFLKHPVRISFILNAPNLISRHVQQKYKALDLASC